MKRKCLYFLPLLLCAALYTSCLRDECKSVTTYIRFDAVYKSLAEIRIAPASESPRALKNPGKIFAMGQYLFINEKQEGIHVIDNSDPANPVPVAFWNIPGNVDIMIRGQYLYADQFVDLLTIDISNFQDIKVVCRAENVFPLFGFDPNNGYIVDYTQTEVTETLDCNEPLWGTRWFENGGFIFVESSVLQADKGNSTGLPSGIAGSFARFGLAQDFLYTVDNTMLRSWSLTDPSCPMRSDSVWLGWNAETIFPFKDRLFIGSQTGVFIFDNTNPAHPVLEARFDHASGCDPVVCDDEYAYVTIHSGTTCNGTFNQLDILDIKNLPSVNLVKTYPMTKPFGLSITNEHLFLCDDGLKIFDRSNPQTLSQLSHLNTVQAYDVIAFSDEHLLLVGDDGFFQYDVSDPASPKQLSAIPVQK